jgi:PGF-CTERM protein
MKHYILAMVVLFFLAAPAMAATLNATQISDTEMLVNGTGFTSGEKVTLSTSTTIPVTTSGRSGSAYSYEMTGLYLPAGSVLTLDASPVKGNLTLHVKIKKYLTLVRNYKYTANATTRTVHVKRSIPSLPGVDGVLFQTIRVHGTTSPNVSVVNLSVTVQRDVNTDGGGSFSELVNINAIPAGNYMIIATDGTATTDSTNTATTDIAIYGSLYSIVITKPDTRELTLNTTEYYPFEAKGYDLKDFVVGHLTFDWTSVSTYVGTINNSTGYFKANNVGNTKVYARGGTKKSKHVTVYVNAPVDNETLSDDTNFTLESGNANVTGNFSVVVSGDVAVQAVGDVTASVSDATTVVGAGYEFISGAIVNVSEKIHDALEGGNGTVTIKLCVNDAILRDMGLARSNVQIYVYNDSAGKWVGLTTTRVGATDCYTADISDYLSEATVGIGSKPAPTPSGGGGDGTYPPGWFETPTPAPAAASTSTPPPEATPVPAGDGVTPSSAKHGAAGVAPTAPAGEEPTKKDIPGFTAVFAIAGMLAIAYVVMRRRR